ncbi:MAG TPA: ABC transporter substrate-binding protein [bacterium]|jgi:phospholipid transport system substrate-binding protein|nr:ABC transporter substrate-binding protein [bacterium]MDX9804322.1 ABC transporter substrate-binding protein [bacterium]HNZ53576.1 ABC transporter substrate-binding protein [bacterium]HOB70510.1 ABC transporter substrate-binding protein [bacterium]HOG43698.1 ABC transporter substrate-binding protein [bacterium]
MKNSVFLLFLLFLSGVVSANETKKVENPAAAVAGNEEFNVNEAVKFLESKEQILEKWANVKPKKGSAQFKQKDADMKKAVEEIIDYKFIASYIIGEKWETTPEEKKEELFSKIKELFTELYLEDTFYNKSYEKKYIDKGIEKMYIKGVPQSVFVTTEVQAALKGKPVIYELIYHLHKVDGSYKVFDIELDTVSMVRNYREQFIKNVKAQSVEELIKMIDKKVRNRKKEGSIFKEKKVS